MGNQTNFISWVEVLRRRAAEAPAHIPFTFLIDGEEQLAQLTYAQLDRHARALAARLQTAKATGGRALLLYPPGLEFIVALFGCWYAAVTAVPAYPPRSAQHSAALTTLATLARDADPSVVLTVSRVSQTITASKIANCPIIATDQISEADADHWVEPDVRSDSLACLQYTSGSTTAPRGVMLTHGHLLANSAIIQDCFGHTSRSHGIIWLPPYHDMGLIGGILQTPYVGCRVTLMAPAAFLQRPVRWLRAISRLGGTTSGGPDFAYNLCVDRVTEEERKTLNLSTWELAFNGAEPIHPRTLDRFAETFAPCGFRREAFYPCYGLAEATLIVSGGEKSAPPILKKLSEDKTVVGCGRPRNTVVIVDPETKIRRVDAAEGEVWLRRNNTPEAYWQRPAETEQTFNAHLADTSEGPFLRTGDLGFLESGDLFITGRTKDLIIIRGVNHHPQDIEHTVQASHGALRPGCGAAFSVNGDGNERLVIVQEIHRTERDAPTEPVIQAIRTAVNERHDVDASSIVLLMPGQILKTSSGKVRRAACRQAMLDGTLETIARWEQPIAPKPPQQPSLDLPMQNGELKSADDVEALLTQMLARAVNLSVDEIDPVESFARYGVDSAGAASLAAELADIIKRDISVTMFYDYPSVRELARHLSAGLQEATE